VYRNLPSPSRQNDIHGNKKAIDQHNGLINLRLETDYTRPYGDGEEERITLITKPTQLDSYTITATKHRVDTAVAQIVLDIYEACFKIRN
jgi:hypothetical protein